jgi:hypothetical protein
MTARRAVRELVAARLYEAILTLASLPDRERAWLKGPRSTWPAPLAGFWDEFGRAVEAGYDALRLRRPAPSPAAIDRMLPTLAWLAWVDERARRLIWLRAFGVSWWKIGARFGRSEKTAQRWHDAAIDLIALRLRLAAPAAAERPAAAD